MPNVNEMFPSKYLKAADLQGHAVAVVIDRVELGEVGQGDDKEQKWIMYFEGKEKGLVLNKTNTNITAAAYGNDTDDWAGKPLELYPTTTTFAGKVVDALRVRTEAPPPAADGEQAKF